MNHYVVFFWVGVKIDTNFLLQLFAYIFKHKKGKYCFKPYIQYKTISSEQESSYYPNYHYLAGAFPASRINGFASLENCILIVLLNIKENSLPFGFYYSEKWESGTKQIVDQKYKKS